MIPLEQRLNVLRLITEAIANGSRRGSACAVLGLSERSLQRWVAAPVDAVSRSALFDGHLIGMFDGGSDRDFRVAH